MFSLFHHSVFLFPENHAILKGIGKVATVANGLIDFLTFKLNVANLKLSILFRALTFTLCLREGKLITTSVLVKESSLVVWHVLVCMIFRA